MWVQCEYNVSAMWVQCVCNVSAMWVQCECNPIWLTTSISAWDGTDPSWSLPGIGPTCPAGRMWPEAYPQSVAASLRDVFDKRNVRMYAFSCPILVCESWNAVVRDHCFLEAWFHNFLLINTALYLLRLETHRYNHFTKFSNWPLGIDSGF